MRGLIRASMMNPWAVTVFCLGLVLLGGLSLTQIPVDILPQFKNPAVQVLTFYSGMPPRNVERDITNRIERWTDMAAGMKQQESRSILGASVVRNYFYGEVTEGEAISSVMSLVQSVLQNLPPGTLPPTVMPFDPTSTTPVCLVALNSPDAGEKTLYDIGRYEVRNRIMKVRGAVSPVVFGGKIRAVQIYLDRERMQARNLSPVDVMQSVEYGNIFLPTGEAIIGGMDYFLDSNSMFEKVEDMGQIPLRTEHGNRAFVGDLAEPKDDAMIQTTIVRVDGRKQVYIPVMRQKGASTLRVIETLKSRLKDIEAQLSRPVNLELIMDQSVYVRQSISSLATEGLLGAGLCSLTILLFLGRLKMTGIAIMTIPLSALSAIAFLYVSGQTINVMTLSGLALAIGPMVDSAIICLENTDRHLEGGTPSDVAALKGASEVALPELVSSLSTLLVLSPLALMPGMGSFLFRPMAIAVAAAMATAYILSRTLIPTCAAAWLKPKREEGDDSGKPRGFIGRNFDRWQRTIDRGIKKYGELLDAVLAHHWIAVMVAYTALLLVLLFLTAPLRREFFPQADAGAFEIYVRAPSGTRLEKTNDRIAEVEDFIKERIPEHDLKIIVSEIGLTPDWSSAYTPNAGKMDSVVRIQLTEARTKGSYEYADDLRRAFAADRRFHDLEFSFNAGGLIRGALNEGKPTPINVRVAGKKREASHEIAERIRRRIAGIDGVVDARIIQRQDYPEYVIDVDRTKAADLGLTQEEVMKSVIAAFNSSIQYNKKNFWVDNVSGNQYFVGVQYPLASIHSLKALLDVPITGVNQNKLGRRVAVERPPTARPLRAEARSPRVTPPVTLGSLVKLRRTEIPTEITHRDILPSVDLNINVHGRDLGHVADDVTKAIDSFGRRRQSSSKGSDEVGTEWDAYDPYSSGRETLEGTQIILSGEYSRMEQTFRDLGIGLCLAVVLIYFLMVSLDKSFLVPLCVLIAVPLILVGVWPMLYLTGTSLNVQSLLGIIFSVGIAVANTVLMTDVAQELRKGEGLGPTEAIRRAAELRVRPVTMTAMAAFFAMLPTALALEKGSEANAPLGRAILGGLLAGEPATLFVVPALYSLMIRGAPSQPKDPEQSEAEWQEDQGDDEGDEGEDDEEE
ncbi:MAG TPA: efflux RND transporter permease subunit [Isosphaeraceae bacterium]|jgi:multidrug efflux pump subunit AcrB|nr:efflux RND transporter permease subunit [Isosphaeraceae bacterium]